MFGTIFHEAAQLVYEKLTERNPVVRRQDIERLMEGKEAALLPFVEASFLKNYFGNDPQAVAYNGQLLIARKVVAAYLRQLLAHDARMEQFVMQEMEKEHRRSVQVTSGERTVAIDIGGKNRPHRHRHENGRNHR